MPARYEDLELHVHQGEPGAYLLSTRSTRFGQLATTSQFDPRADWVQDALLLLRSGNLPRDQLERLGTLLFSGLPAAGLHGLLPPLARDQLRLCEGALDSAPGVGLQLRLRVDPPELAAIPWEYLFDPLSHKFLSTSRDPLLYRSVTTPQKSRPLRLTLPLQGLFIAAPADGLDTGLEADLVARLSDPDLITWETVRGEVSLELIREKLRRGRYHLLHFAGHGAFEREGVLYLESRHSRLSVSELADLLLNHETIRLVFINACEVGQPGLEASYGGLARRLLERRVPAVIAMQQPISEAGALRFARAVYRELLSGPLPGQVGAAVNVARGELLVREDAAGTEARPGEFGAPVLYLGSSEATLFRARHRRRWTRLRKVAIWLAVMVVMFLLRGTEWFEPFDLYRHDRWVELAGPAPLRSPVTVVDLDDGPEPWPWRRETFVRLLERLWIDGRVQTLLVDVALPPKLYADETPAARQAANARLVALASMVDTYRRIAFAIDAELVPPSTARRRAEDATPQPSPQSGQGPAPSSTTSLSMHEPLYALRDLSPPEPGLERLRYGFADVLTQRAERDAVRQVPLFASPEGGEPDAALPALGIATLVTSHSYRRVSVLPDGRDLETGSHLLVQLPPIDPDGLEVIGASVILGAPDCQAIEGPETPGRISQPCLLRESLQGRHVVVGRYSRPDPEERFTAPGVAHGAFRATSGVALQAGLLAQALQGSFTRRTDRPDNLVLQSIWLSAMGLLLWRQKGYTRMLLVCFASFSAALYLEYAVLAYSGLWIDAPVPEVILLSLAFSGSGLASLLFSRLTRQLRAADSR